MNEKQVAILIFVFQFCFVFSNFEGSSQTCEIGVIIIILQMNELGFSKVSPLPEFTELVNK